jgi:hypothetical protein
MEQIENLISTYKILMEYVPSKDAQGAADHLMSVLIESLDEQALDELVANSDGYLKRAHKEYEVEDDSDEEEGYYDE